MNDLKPFEHAYRSWGLQKSLRFGQIYSWPPNVWNRLSCKIRATGEALFHRMPAQGDASQAFSDKQ
jgi:hypothetical protein